jgi:type IV secretion system protein VirD4
MTFVGKGCKCDFVPSTTEMEENMYRFLRYILIATVLLVAYLAALVIYLVPYAWLVAVGIVVFMLFKKTYRLTAHGTARWAQAEDLEGMIDE